MAGKRLVARPEWQRNVIVRHGKVTEITLRVAPGAVEKPKK